jgi:hypothetical protein
MFEAREGELSRARGSARDGGRFMDGYVYSRLREPDGGG